MHQFVWARALCGTRIRCCASVDCSGVIRKIYVSEIEVKVTGMHAIMMDFMIWGCLTRPRGPFRTQGSALTRNVEKYTWLEEIASKSHIIQAQEEFLSQGRLQAKTSRNYIYDLVGFSLIFLD